MKILYVSAEYFPAEIAMSIRSKFNVAALSQRGCKVTVLTTGDTRAGPGGEVVIGIGRYIVDHTSSLRHRLLGELGAGFAFGRHILRNRKSYNKVVITSPPFFALIITSLFLWVLRIPYVVDIRDRYPQTLFSLGLLNRTSVVSRVLLYVERKIYIHSEAVMAVTTPLKSSIQIDSGVDVKVVRNGFDERIFEPHYRSDHAGNTVQIVQHGLFGRLVDGENLENIIKYCANHASKHRFLLIGYGMKLDAIASKNLPNVTILSKQSQQDIAMLLSASDIGLASMVQNENTLTGIPVKVFEYIGAGLPILHSPVGVTGKEISDNGLGLAFSNQDWESAARWLVTMIESKELREEYARNVRNVRHQYSRQAQSKLFADIVCAASKQCL